MCGERFHGVERLCHRDEHCQKTDATDGYGGERKRARFVRERERGECS